MGMFDTFETNNSFTCPSCHKDFKFQNGIQTKQFDCVLDNYVAGDIVDNFDSKRQFLYEEDWCPYCDADIEVYISFNNFIFVEIYQTEQEAIKASDDFDILDNYLKLHSEKTKYETKFKGLMNNLESVYTLHSKKNTKSKFTALSLLRHYELLDYNPIQTIKNIIDKFKDD